VGGDSHLIRVENVAHSGLICTVCAALTDEYENSIRNGFPGTRSLQGSHPYWLGHDRVMADEFFRPGFTNGVFATGEIFPRLHSNAMVGNNLSQLGLSAAKLTRDIGGGVSFWWNANHPDTRPYQTYAFLAD
jgi:hypothetical protein